MSRKLPTLTDEDNARQLDRLMRERDRKLDRINPDSVLQLQDANGLAALMHAATGIGRQFGYLCARLHGADAERVFGQVGLALRLYMQTAVRIESADDDNAEALDCWLRAMVVAMSRGALACPVYCVEPHFSPDEIDCMKPKENTVQ